LTEPLRQLSLFDAVLLLVGGTIGPAIFLTPAEVAAQIPNPVLFLLMWVVVGLITLIAGLACAELGGMFPEAGGQYVYIREAYGHFPAFIYGWVLFTVGNSGAIAAISVMFALFVGRIFPALSADKILCTLTLPLGQSWHLSFGSAVAVGSTVFLTWINIIGIRRAAAFYKTTTLLLTAGLALLVVLGLLVGHGSWSHFLPASGSLLASPAASAYGLAFVALFWTYDGWTFVSWVAGEVRDARRTIPRALIIGITLVILIYVSANILFIYAMPVPLLASNSTAAISAVEGLFSQRVGLWVSLLIAISCIGSNSVVVMSGPRIYYAMAKDEVFFPALKKLNSRTGTPVMGLVVQCIWTSVVTISGRYEQIYTCYIFMMTLTYVFTIGAVFVLRRTRPNQPRAYLCVGYPWLPGIYLLIAAAFVIGTLVIRPWESLTGLALAVCGVPGYLYWQRRKS
jgi:basic amino acid/polyamine antiporter, APA family